MDEHYQPNDPCSKGHPCSRFQRVRLLNHLICGSPHLRSRRPEFASQSNLSAQRGAELWRAYLQPLKAQGLRLGSPAPTNAPAGKIWLQDFLTACGDCTVDFMTTHWYGINSTQFVNYLQDIHNTFQRPVWVTEWACQVSTLLKSFIHVEYKWGYCRTLSRPTNNARIRM